MSDLRVGRIVRAVRVHHGMRQRDVADLAGVDRSVVSDLEHGRLERVSLHTARKVCEPLQIELAVEARWRGGAVDRLVDHGHARLVERTARELRTRGWIVEAELTFNVYGDRGSVDLVGWHEERRALCLIEVKTALTDLQAMLMSMSKKVRVVPIELERQRGWRRRALGCVLVVLGSTANRAVVRNHPVVFDSTFPAGTAEVRAWLRQPGAWRASGSSRLWF